MKNYSKSKKSFGERARILFYGFLLSCLFSIIACLIFKREFLTSLQGLLTGNVLMVLIPALVVGWRLQKASWREGALFTMLCLFLYVRSIKRMICAIAHPSDLVEIYVLYLGTVILFGVCGVLGGGFLFHKIKRRKIENS